MLRFSITSYLFFLIAFTGINLSVPIPISANENVDGLVCHGIAAPVSRACGVVTTLDEFGNSIVLVWLSDFRGGYALLKINVLTGKTEEFKTPFNLHKDSAPFSSLLSSQNRYYTHFDNHFLEFNISENRFTKIVKTTSKVAMSMTEDDNGVIWSVAYPDCGLISYNPANNEFHDYGSIYEQEWKQYPRFIFSDDKGWIYVSVGHTAAQIIAFNPLTKKGIAIIPESERKQLLPILYRDMNGKVYANYSKEFPENSWHELYKGKKQFVGKQILINKKKYITGTQSLRDNQFPDGSHIKLDLLKHELKLLKGTILLKLLKLKYTSQGALIISVVASSDGVIYGSTYHPMYIFMYDQQKDQLDSLQCIGQWNAFTIKDQRAYIGAYPHGRFMEWELSKDWNPTNTNIIDSNPLIKYKCSSDIYRPYKVLAHMDEKTVIMAGSPAYGHTGGGMLFWDTTRESSKLLEHHKIIKNHSVRSLVSLDNSRILGGTTISPGTGGIKKATIAELFIMDNQTKTILWHDTVIPKAKEYSDLCLAQNGKVYGIADRMTFFVFDTTSKKVIYRENLPCAMTYQQGQRMFVQSPSNVYILYAKGIVIIDPATYKLNPVLETPFLLTAGGDYLNERIYFGSYSKIFSFNVNESCKIPSQPIHLNIPH